MQEKQKNKFHKIKSFNNKNKDNKIQKYIILLKTRTSVVRGKSIESYKNKKNGRKNLYWQ